MEALIVAAAALVAVVLLEAGYRIAISLSRWAPVIIVAALVGWLADRHGFAPLEALSAAIAAALIARHLLRPCWRFE